MSIGFSRSAEPLFLETMLGELRSFHALLSLTGTLYHKPVEGPATHLSLVFIACRRYETKHDFAGPTWEVRQNHVSTRSLYI